MSKSFKVFRIAVVMAALLPLSCATRLPQPKGSASLNDTNSIVFGKIQVTVNNEPVNPKRSQSVLHEPYPVIQCSISPYISDNKLDKNPFKPGKYFFNTDIDKNGYFSFVIPPGKYYFVEFQYIWLFPDQPSLGVRTYMSKNPVCMSFEVPANRAVYIGTILNDVSPEWNAPYLFETYYFSLGITNDFTGAKSWFLKSNPGLETNVLERDINITPL